MTTLVKKSRKQKSRSKAATVDVIAMGRRIRELRGFYTEQSEFAKLLGVSQSQLSKYERGETEPPLNVLVRLSKRFKRSLDWLVTGKD